MALQTLTQENTHYLYNDVFGEFSPRVFIPPENTPTNTNTKGRGEALFFTWGHIKLVKKHFYRGGLVRHFSRQTYRYTGLQRTRMWRELYLLNALQLKNLPVPSPFAAKCSIHFGSFYRGELITQEIQNANTFAHLLDKQLLTEADWCRIGATLKLFHNNNVYHADLNANNILLDDTGQVWLIDFDKGKIRENENPAWKQENLKRLERSLSKIDHFRQAGRKGWQQLLASYTEN